MGFGVVDGWPGCADCCACCVDGCVCGGEEEMVLLAWQLVGGAAA
jgi:hypothetical protein